MWYMQVHMCSGGVGVVLCSVAGAHVVEESGP